MPMFNRLPGAQIVPTGAEADEQSSVGDSAGSSDFLGVDFLKVELKPDDGLVMQVFEEAFVSPTATPCFVFLSDCLELRKWRYQGADISEVVKRIKRIEANDRLDDGPDAEET